MTIISIASMLVASGFCDVRPCVSHDVDESAHMVREACGDGPRSEPSGYECAAAVAAVWYLEARFRLYPRHRRGDGCGPGQQLPGRWGNSRVGYGMTPTCDRLRVPAVGLAWAIKSLRAKAPRVRGMEALLRAYNGHPRHRDRYGRRGLAIYLRAMEVAR